jgi:hypothetical protein
MNKRLLLALYDRSGLGAYMPVDFKGHQLEVEEHMEQFAKLVVLECARVVKASSPNGMIGVNAIRIHFGIEP